MTTVPETLLAFINLNNVSGRASSLGGSVVSLAQGYFESLFQMCTWESMMRKPREVDSGPTSVWVVERTGRREGRQRPCPRCSTNSRLVRCEGIPERGAKGERISRFFFPFLFEPFPPLTSW